MSNVLIAFRTHIWDSLTQKLAYKLYLETTDFDFVILFDETNKQVNTKPFEKVSHTADMSSLGLPHWPTDVVNLHYNGDYALYCLRKQKPNYQFYLMIEGDVSVNIDLPTLINRCLKEQIDFVGQIRQVNDPSAKEFFLNILKWFPSYASCFFPFVGASAQLIDALYESKLSLKTNNNIQQDWPYCEAFVGSFVVSNPNFKYINLDSVANLDYFTWLNAIHIDDRRIYTKGTIMHPIASSTTFINKCTAYNDIETIFDKNSTLFTGIQSEDPNIFLPILEHQIKLKKNPNLLTKFWNYALLQGWIKLPHPINVAFMKPASQSSICSASRFQNIEQDASLLVDGILEHSSRSHTDYEEKPWVMIDLIDHYDIRSIFIYVRPDCSQNFCDFRIDLSINGQEWFTLYKKIDNIPPDSQNLKPIIINASPGNKARFVKIIQENAGWLHLNQVEIYAY